MNVVEWFEKCNWQTILAMFAIGWWFTREIRMSLNKLENDVREQGKRTDKLYEIWCQTQKDMCDMRKELDQKFYDILKERKE